MTAAQYAKLTPEEREAYLEGRRERRCRRERRRRRRERKRRLAEDMTPTSEG
jgi:hypothetical protein